ncbi:hypothetical protein F4604DRAFT_1933356 [Suillus subluteus]|nr:hypothetical protein F4604DRAFT_1933356 [Suillus subluteus]
MSILPSFAPTFASAQPNPPLIFGTLSSNVAPASAPSAPVPLMFDLGNKPASTIPKPVATSPPTATTVDPAKKTSPLFTFSVATQSRIASLVFKSTPDFGALSRTSVFATAPSLGKDAKKTDEPLSIFGAANATKEDGSKVGASTPAVFFGGVGFGANANGVLSNIFDKSSAPQPSGDASASTTTLKSVFGNATSNNVFSTTRAVSPVILDSA